MMASSSYAAAGKPHGAAVLQAVLGSSIDWFTTPLIPPCHGWVKDL